MEDATIGNDALPKYLYIICWTDRDLAEKNLFTLRRFRAARKSIEFHLAFRHLDLFYQIGPNKDLLRYPTF